MKIVFPLITTLFFIFILWILFLANTGQNSVFFTFITKIPYGDKLGHFCLFGLLTLMANFAFKLKVVKLPLINLKSCDVYLGALIVFIFVLCEELSQFFIVSRTLDVIDFLANVVGIVSFSWLTTLLNKRQHYQNT